MVLNVFGSRVVGRIATDLRVQKEELEKGECVSVLLSLQLFLGSSTHLIGISVSLIDSALEKEHSRKKFQRSANKHERMTAVRAICKSCEMVRNRNAPDIIYLHLRREGELIEVDSLEAFRNT